MNEITAIRVTKHLLGKVVLDAETAWKKGVVTDVVINPVEGTVVALLFRAPSGEELALALDGFFINGEATAVIEIGEPMTDPDVLKQAMENGARAEGELVGSDVVTKDGRLLGRVTEVLLQTNPMRVIYQIATSRWQRFFGGGIYLADGAPCAYSRVGARLIAPSDTRYVFRSLMESVKAGMQKSATA
jgi:sporulation protein YlmC with PRC-barrel domain